MLRNKVGPGFDSKNVIFARFSLKSHSPCRKKTIFEKQKKKNRENLDQVLTQKRLFLDQVLTLQHAYIYIYHGLSKSVQQMVSGELAGECLQTGFERHGLPPQRAPLSREYCEGLFPDTLCWTRLRNTWYINKHLSLSISLSLYLSPPFLWYGLGLCLAPGFINSLSSRVSAKKAQRDLA